MSGCGSCTACGGSDQAREYINSSGQSSVKCTLCEKEIVFTKLPANRRVECSHCGNEVEVIPLILN